MRWTRADRPDLARFPRRRSRGGGGKAKWEGKKRRRDVPVVLPDADAGVGGAEVDADGGTVNLSHDVLLWWSKCVWVATVGAVRVCWKVMQPTRRKRQFAFFRAAVFASTMVHDLLLNRNGRPRDTPGLTNREKRRNGRWKRRGKNRPWFSSPRDLHYFLTVIPYVAWNAGPIFRIASFQPGGAGGEA